MWYELGRRSCLASSARPPRRRRGCPARSNGDGEGAQSPRDGARPAPIRTGHRAGGAPAAPPQTLFSPQTPPLRKGGHLCLAAPPPAKMGLKGARARTPLCSASDAARLLPVVVTPPRRPWPRRAGMCSWPRTKAAGRGGPSGGSAPRPPWARLPRAPAAQAGRGKDTHVPTGTGGGRRGGRGGGSG